MEVKSLEIIQRGLRLHLLLAAILGKRVSITHALASMRASGLTESGRAVKSCFLQRPGEASGEGAASVVVGT